MTGTISWSYTTTNAFRQCNRKYFFASLMANHNWKTPVRRKAYELRAMQNLTMWKGSVVDKFLEKVIVPSINKKQLLNFEQLAEQAVEMAAKQFKFSKNQFYKNPEQKKGDADEEYCILDIHELGTEYTEAEIIECYAVIRQAILNIPDIRMPDGSLLIDFLIAANSLIPNVSNWLVYIEKARVKPQIDLIAYQNWKPVIIDWKLSDSFVSDYSRQLLIAGLIVYLKRKIDYPEKKPFDYHNIKLFEVNLLKSAVKEHDFTAEGCNDMIDYINLTSSDMAIIADKKYDELNIDDFEPTDNEGSCISCNFRSLCSFLFKNKNYDEKSYIEFVQNQQLV